MPKKATRTNGKAASSATSSGEGGEGRGAGAKSSKTSKATKATKGNKNRKAFSVANIGRSQRNIQRNLDKAQQKEVKPLTNKSLESVQHVLVQAPPPPPPLVVVMGPRGVGKSTLIRSLVKMFTGQNITDTTGPITVAASKQRRVTLFECPLDLYSMTDLAKVADLVLLMVDASYGFEMETFEYLNLLQLHGFPKVMAVFTHLDAFKASKTLQNTKKALKHRFWTEIYKGAKVFEFMGVVNGKYRKHEVKRLALYVSRVKFRPLVWRNTHPYLLIDRVEDVTPIRSDGSNSNNSEQREVALFGYVRGSNLKSSMQVHLIGAGDFPIASLTALPDPCPLQQATEAGGMSLKRQKDSLLYAPLANVGRVTMDRDGMYIELKHVNYSRPDQLHITDQQQQQQQQLPQQSLMETPADLLRSMQQVDVAVDEQLRSEQQKSAGAMSMSLFANNTSDGASDDDNDDGSGNDSDGNDSDGDGDGDNHEQMVNDDTLISDDEYLAVDDDADDDADAHDDEIYDGESNYDSGDNSDSDNDDDDSNDGSAEVAAQQVSSDALPATAAAAAAKSFMMDIGGRSTSASSETRRDFDLGNSNEHTDIMRAVYGWDWTSNNNISSSTGNDVAPSSTAPDDDDDDELFQSFSADGARRNSKSSIMMRRLRYALNNALNSSRVWWIGAAEASAEEQEAALLLTGGNDSNVSNSSSSINRSSGGCGHGGGIAINYQQQISSSNDDVAISAGGEITMTAVAAALADIDSSDGAAADSSDSAAASAQYSWLWTALKTRCVTGGWGAQTIDAAAGGAAAGDDDVYGEFEDLQTGQVFGSSTATTKDTGIDSDDDEDAVEAKNEQIDRQLRDLNASKKAQFKASFDKMYDDKELKDDRNGHKKKKSKGGDEDDGDEDGAADGAVVAGEFMEAAKRQLEAQRDINVREFASESAAARLQLEGCRQGVYVRILLRHVPRQFTQNFRSHVPCVLGGLLHHEADTMGFITARVKRHRWHRRMLKSNDPLIFSIGWRRYQSIPIYTTTDQNERERYLKYTPEHMHCTATFYGPLVPPNTGILGFQNADSSRPDFRISLTGTVLSQRATPQVVKKLKLVGSPVRIYKNSAFIAGMFNSALEVARFEHAKLKTVSGIRGSIKKALRESNAVAAAAGGLSNASLAKQPPGTFRATFEDKILLSDLVVCRLWVPVLPKEFYNPVLTLLYPTTSSATTAPAITAADTSAVALDDSAAAVSAVAAVDNSSGGPALMRTTAQMRRSLQVPQQVQRDSLYKPVVRVRREFKRLKIPAKLQDALPFASKPKQLQPRNRQTYLARRAAAAAVVREPEERRAQAQLQRLSALKNLRLDKRKTAAENRQSLKRKAQQQQSDKFADEQREKKRQKYREEGKQKAREQQQQQRQSNKKHRKAKN